MVALILADGDVPTRARLDAAWPGWDAGVDLVVAADGGARHARTLGVDIDVWVGDGDSIAPADLAALTDGGVDVERWPIDKDASDTDLAIDAAFQRGPTMAIVLGALGGPRVDHALSNIGLLARHDRLGRVTILDARSRLTVIGPADAGGLPTHRLTGGPGDVVTLLPIDGDLRGVTTDGLRYPLVDAPLIVGTSRGLSNVIERAGASVAVGHGRLLVIESPVRL